MSNGLGRLLGRLRRPDLGSLRHDAVAGVPGAIGSVPDGMASAALIGINPVYGLYASIAGPIAGGAAASTRLMVITTTTAAALAVASAVDGFSGDRRAEAVFLLTVIAGLLMAGAALLRLGRYVRFVSVSVLTGFLTAVAVNIVGGQLADLLGTTASGPFPLAKAWDVLTDLGAVSLASAAVGLGALAILVGLARTRLADYSAIVALLVPTILALGSEEVAQVDDAGPIPTGIPSPTSPTSDCWAALPSGRARRRWPSSCWSRARAWPRWRPTPTAARPTRIATSWPRGSATSRPGCCAASRWADRSARPRSTSPQGPGAARRRSCPASGCS